ncbi:unnamed protein product [Nippostrongylus brasiliensis]|uniref:Helo_like_N domain-containing protein n=1 Tax=Nippostrongylus brasiliensis TaxID=27835 RepID=A0A0N4YU32_NIPBR|nr:unnamed protein product [Nippostrongylus brasiliensis]
MPSVVIVRGFFASLLCYSEISNANVLWNEFSEAMAEDSDHQGCSCCRECLLVTRGVLEEILERIKQVEVTIANRDSDRNIRSYFDSMASQQAEAITLLRNTSYGTARPSGDEPNWAIISKEKVLQIRKLRRENMTKFALDLESDLFTDDPDEQLMAVEERGRAADKVEFIKDVTENISDLM